jgi:ABC-type ATPase involved in cell division
MSRIDLVVNSELQRSTRVKQLEGMFDVPAREKLTHEWRGELPIEDKEWNLGLIVGPSGSGKSLIARHVFGKIKTNKWGNAPVIDEFAQSHDIEAIANVCSAVGFNTIPSWMKSYAILSNGERFRVDLARKLLEDVDPIVVDEFTSVVDRQVAKIASNAVQKYVRKNKRQFVAISCHYDIVDWLQPDWVLEPTTMTFKWRSLQRRPEIAIEIVRTEYKTWHLFAPFHYLSNELSRSAACFLLLIENQPACFAAVLHRPHSGSTNNNIKAVSRVVTLPDYQGLGLAFVLMEILASAYKACGYRLRNYPAHPPFVRAHDRSPKWRLCKKPGTFQSARGISSAITGNWRTGSRSNAVFEFCGERMQDALAARRLLGIESNTNRREFASIGIDRKRFGG